MSSKILMLAPGHDELDHRVLRSFYTLKNLYPNSVLYFESKRVNLSFVGDGEKEIYDSISISDLVFLRRRLLGNKVFIEISNSKYLYIHDSGLYGLFFVRFINHYFPEKKIIFDYHDFLNWEVLHHISKFVKFKIISKIFLSITLFTLNRFILNKIRIHALIGISEGQMTDLSSRLGSNVKHNLVVPNTRIWLSQNFEFSKVLDICNFLWIGNVGANRSFKVINNFTSLFSANFPNILVEISVIGKVWGSGERLLENVNNLGAYQSDIDILQMLPKKKNIGIFFGWGDEFNLGINHIGSPNKIYTYINLGVPFLMPSSLTDLIDNYSIDGCFLFFNEIDFLQKARYIYDNYEVMLVKVNELKERVSWDETIKASLLNFYRKSFDYDC